MSTTMNSSNPELYAENPELAFFEECYWRRPVLDKLTVAPPAEEEATPSPFEALFEQLDLPCQTEIALEKGHTAQTLPVTQRAAKGSRASLFDFHSRVISYRKFLFHSRIANDVFHKPTLEQLLRHALPAEEPFSFDQCPGRFPSKWPNSLDSLIATLRELKPSALFYTPLKLNRGLFSELDRKQEEFMQQLEQKHNSTSLELVGKSYQAELLIAMLKGSFYRTIRALRKLKHVGETLEAAESQAVTAGLVECLSPVVRKILQKLEEPVFDFYPRISETLAVFSPASLKARAFSSVDSFALACDGPYVYEAFTSAQHVHLLKIGTGLCGSEAGRVYRNATETCQTPRHIALVCLHGYVLLRNNADQSSIVQVFECETLRKAGHLQLDVSAFFTTPFSSLYNKSYQLFTDGNDLYTVMLRLLPAPPKSNAETRESAIKHLHFANGGGEREASQVGEAGGEERPPVAVCPPEKLTVFKKIKRTQMNPPPAEDFPDSPTDQLLLATHYLEVAGGHLPQLSAESRRMGGESEDDSGTQTNSFFENEESSSEPEWGSAFRRLGRGHATGVFTQPMASIASVDRKEKAEGPTSVAEGEEDSGEHLPSMGDNQPAEESLSSSSTDRRGSGPGDTQLLRMSEKLMLQRILLSDSLRNRVRREGAEVANAVQVIEEHYRAAEEARRIHEAQTIRQTLLRAMQDAAEDMSGSAELASALSFDFARLINIEQKERIIRRTIEIKESVATPNEHDVVSFYAVRYSIADALAQLPKLTAEPSAESKKNRRLAASGGMRRAEGEGPARREKTMVPMAEEVLIYQWMTSQQAVGTKLLTPSDIQNAQWFVRGRLLLKSTGQLFSLNPDDSYAVEGDLDVAVQGLSFVRKNTLSASLLAETLTDAERRSAALTAVESISADQFEAKSLCHAAAGASDALRTTYIKTYPTETSLSGSLSRKSTYCPQQSFFVTVTVDGGGGNPLKMYGQSFTVQADNNLARESMWQQASWAPRVPAAYLLRLLQADELGRLIDALVRFLLFVNISRTSRESRTSDWQLLYRRAGHGTKKHATKLKRLLEAERERGPRIVAWEENRPGSRMAEVGVAHHLCLAGRAKEVLELRELMLAVGNDTAAAVKSLLVFFSLFSRLTQKPADVHHFIDHFSTQPTLQSLLVENYLLYSFSAPHLTAVLESALSRRQLGLITDLFERLLGSNDLCLARQPFTSRAIASYDPLSKEKESTLEFSLNSRIYATLHVCAFEAESGEVSALWQTLYSPEHFQDCPRPAVLLTALRKLCQYALGRLDADISNQTAAPTSLEGVRRRSECYQARVKIIDFALEVIRRVRLESCEGPVAAALFALIDMVVMALFDARSLRPTQKQSYLLTLQRLIAYLLQRGEAEGLLRREALVALQAKSALEGVSPLDCHLRETTHPVERNRTTKFPLIDCQQAVGFLVEFDPRCHSEESDALHISSWFADDKHTTDQLLFKSVVLSVPKPVPRVLLLPGNCFEVEFVASSIARNNAKTLSTWGHRLLVRPIFSPTTSWSRAALPQAEGEGRRRAAQTLLRALEGLTVTARFFAEEFMRGRVWGAAESACQEVLQWSLLQNGMAAASKDQIFDIREENLTLLLQERSERESDADQVSQRSKTFAERRSGLLNDANVLDVIKAAKDEDGNFALLVQLVRDRLPANFALNSERRRPRFTAQLQQSWLKAERLIVAVCLYHAELFALAQQHSREDILFFAEQPHIAAELGRIADTCDGVLSHMVREVQVEREFSQLYQQLLEVANRLLVGVGEAEQLLPAAEVEGEEADVREKTLERLRQQQSKSRARNKPKSARKPRERRAEAGERQARKQEDRLARIDLNVLEDVLLSGQFAEEGQKIITERLEGQHEKTAEIFRRRRLSLCHYPRDNHDKLLNCLIGHIKADVRAALPHSLQLPLNLSPSNPYVLVKKEVRKKCKFLLKLNTKGLKAEPPIADSHQPRLSRQESQRTPPTKEALKPPRMIKSITTVPRQKPPVTPGRLQQVVDQAKALKNVLASEERDVKSPNCAPVYAVGRFLCGEENYTVEQLEYALYKSSHRACFRVIGAQALVGLQGLLQGTYAYTYLLGTIAAVFKSMNIEENVQNANRQYIDHLVSLSLTALGSLQQHLNQLFALVKEVSASKVTAFKLSLGKEREEGLKHRLGLMEGMGRVVLLGLSDMLALLNSPQIGARVRQTAREERWTALFGQLVELQLLLLPFRELSMDFKHQQTLLAACSTATGMLLQLLGEEVRAAAIPSLTNLLAIEIGLDLKQGSVDAKQFSRLADKVCSDRVVLLLKYLRLALARGQTGQSKADSNPSNLTDCLLTIALRTPHLRAARLALLCLELCPAAMQRLHVQLTLPVFSLASSSRNSSCHRINRFYSLRASTTPQKNTKPMIASPRRLSLRPLLPESRQSCLSALLTRTGQLMLGRREIADTRREDRYYILVNAPKDADLCLLFKVLCAWEQRYPSAFTKRLPRSMAELGPFMDAWSARQQLRPTPEQRNRKPVKASRGALQEKLSNELLIANLPDDAEAGWEGNAGWFLAGAEPKGARFARTTNQSAPGNERRRIAEQRNLLKLHSIIQESLTYLRAQYGPAPQRRPPAAEKPKSEDILTEDLNFEILERDPLPLEAPADAAPGDLDALKEQLTELLSAPQPDPQRVFLLQQLLTTYQTLQGGAATGPTNDAEFIEAFHFLITAFEAVKRLAAMERSLINNGFALLQVISGVFEEKHDRAAELLQLLSPSSRHQLGETTPPFKEEGLIRKFSQALKLINEPSTALDFSFALCHSSVGGSVGRYLETARENHIPREDFSRFCNKFFSANYEALAVDASMKAAKAFSGFTRRAALQCLNVRAELQNLFRTLLDKCTEAEQSAEPNAAWLGALVLFVDWSAEPTTSDALTGAVGGTAIILAGLAQTGCNGLLAVNSATGEVSKANDKDIPADQCQSPFTLSSADINALAGRAQSLKQGCSAAVSEQLTPKQLLNCLGQRLECALLLRICLTSTNESYSLPQEFINQLRNDFTDGTLLVPQAASDFFEATSRAIEQRALPLLRPEGPVNTAARLPTVKTEASDTEFTETPSSYFSDMSMSHPHHSHFKMLKHWEKNIIPRILSFVKGSLSNYEIEDFFEQIRIELRKENHIRASNIAYVLCDQRLPVDCELPAFNHDWTTCEFGELRLGQWVSVRVKDERGHYAPALLPATRAGLTTVLGQVLLKDYTHNTVNVLVRSLDLQHVWAIWVPQQAVRLPEVALAPPVATLPQVDLLRACDATFNQLWKSLVRDFFLQRLNNSSAGVVAEIEQLLVSMNQQLAGQDILTGWVAIAEQDRRHNDLIELLYKEAHSRGQLLATIAKEAEQLTRTLSTHYATDLSSAEGEMLALHQPLCAEDIGGVVVEFRKSASLFKCSGLRFCADADDRVTLAQLQATQKKSLGQFGPLLFNSHEVFTQFYSNEEALPVFARSERNTNLECCVYALSRRWNAFFWLLERLSLLAAETSDAETFGAVVQAVVKLCKQLQSPGLVRTQLLNFFSRLLLRLRQTHLPSGQVLVELDAVMRGDELRLGEISALLGEETDEALPSLRQQQAAEFLSIYRAYAELRGVKLPLTITQNPVEKDISTLVSLCELTAGCPPDARLRGLFRALLHPRHCLDQLILITQIPPLGRVAVEEALRAAFRTERFKLLCPELDVYVPTDSEGVCVGFAMVLFDGLAAPHIDQPIAEEAPEPEAPAESLQWYCDTCTLLNPDTVDVCGVCEMPKPQHPTYAETAAPPEKKERDWLLCVQNRQNTLLREILREFERLTPDRRICARKLSVEGGELAELTEVEEFLMHRITHDCFSARLLEVAEEIFAQNAEYFQGDGSCGSGAMFGEQLAQLEPLALFERLAEFGYDAWLEKTGLSAHATNDFALPERHDLVRFRDFLEDDVCANTLFVTEVGPRDFRLEFKSPLLALDVFADRALERLTNAESRAFYTKHMRMISYSNLHFRCAIAFFRLFNNLFGERYLYIDMLSPATNTGGAGSLSVGALVSRNRDLLFSAVKNQVVQELLRNTALVRDETPKVVVDRFAREYNAEVRGGKSRAVSEDRSEFMQAFRQLGEVSPTLLRPVKPKGSEPYICFEVVFKGEHVMGDAGPYRQFFADISSELQPESGTVEEARRLPLFISSPNQQNSRGDAKDKALPNPSCRSAHHLQLFEFVGVLMGCCFRTRTFLALELPALFWKRMVRHPITEQDLEEVDQGMIELLRFVRTCPPDVFEEHIFESFTATLSDKSVVELVLGGSGKRVTYANRLEYAERVAEARLNEARAQTEAIRRGMTRIVPEAVLSLLTYADLEEKVCGRKAVDFDLLRKHTRYSGGLTEDSPLIHNFWEVLLELSDADKRRFVKFCWGQERLPLSSHSYEHSSTRFLVKPAMYAGSHEGVLPKADTCFFNFELPNYSSKEVMRERILLAIHTDADSLNAEEREFEQNLQYDENNATFYSDLSD